MSTIVLFEDSGFANLLPMLYWRSVFEVRCGHATLGERLQRLIGSPAGGLWTRAWMTEVAAERSGLPINQPIAPGDVLVNGRWLPDARPEFPPGPAIGRCDGEIAFVVCDGKLSAELGPEYFLDPERRTEFIGLAPAVKVGGAMVCYPWDVVARSAELLVSDWEPDEAAMDGDVHPSAVVVHEEGVRIEAGAQVQPCVVLDATDGPIVLERDVSVGAHACICGPAHVAAGSVINPRAYLHGGTSIGPVCKIGGEVDACVFQGYSNKQHEGFLGHSYVGNWVNLGAGTVNSDLKNTYGPVRAPLLGDLVDTGLTFVGAVIGDHTKTAIGTTIPTGAVLGFAVNVAYSRMLPQFVRSFSWLTDRGMEEGDYRRLEDTARKSMARRQVDLTKAEEALFDKLPQIVAYFEPALIRKRAYEPDADASDLTPMARTEGPGAR